MKILIAEDDPVSSRVLSSTLQKWGHEVVSVNNGDDACEKFKDRNPPRLAILDWMMPGISGLEICRYVRQHVCSSPYLILLTAINRKEDLGAGLDAGADDYITKPFDRQELKLRLRAGIRFVELQNSLADRVSELEAASVERQRVEEELRSLSLTDDLTGLYNRRGFLTLAAHHVKTARRSNMKLFLLYCDMDNLKQINDAFGHAEGSVAIRHTANILRQTFRDSDVVGRLGGDEFVTLGSVSGNGIETITERLDENIRYHNQQSGRAYKLSLSIGAICFDPNVDTNIEDLIVQADRRMYAEKRRKKQTAFPRSVKMYGVEWALLPAAN